MMKTCPKCRSNNTDLHPFETTVYECKDCGRLFEVPTLMDNIFSLIIILGLISLLTYHGIFS